MERPECEDSVSGAQTSVPGLTGLSGLWTCLWWKRGPHSQAPGPWSLFLFSKPTVKFPGCHRISILWPEQLVGGKNVLLLAGGQTTDVTAKSQVSPLGSHLPTTAMLNHSAAMPLCFNDVLLILGHRLCASPVKFTPKHFIVSLSCHRHAP